MIGASREMVSRVMKDCRRAVHRNAGLPDRAARHDHAPRAQGPTLAAVGKAARSGAPAGEARRRCARQSGCC